MSVGETLLWLCAIPSPIGEERALCDAVQARLAGLPLAAPVRRYGDSLVVPVTRGKGPRIALVGHLDTVRTENGPARIDGDRCIGAGASDMKSGLAVMLELVEKLDLAALACQLTLVFYAREEGPFAENELGPVLAEDPELGQVDLAVCLEPSDNKLHLGCMGSIHATVTFEGQTAHSARPWQGENAITKSADLLAKLGALKARESVVEGLAYRGATTVTQAHDGGRGRNVVPDRFVLNVNHRFAPDRTLDEAVADLRHILGDGARVDFTDLSPAAPPAASHPLVQKLVAAGVRGVEPKRAWTDVARFAARGIAAVNFGPGENAQAHQKNESTSLALVDEGYAIVARWLTSLSVVALAVACALPACRPFRASSGDGGPAEDPGGAGADAAGGGTGPIAENDADITRYPDETAVDHVLGVTRLVASNARTQAGASLGTVVAALPPGTSVDKIAVRRGWFLVVFIDPKDPGAGRRELGWLDPTDFVAPTGKLPAVHCELPRVAVTRAGRTTCELPAPPGSSTAPPVVPLPEAGPAPKPSRPLDVKQQNGACPGGYAKCSALCRLQCGRDADCGLASAHCQAGFCLGPGAQPCGG